MLLHREPYGKDVHGRGCFRPSVKAPKQPVSRQNRSVARAHAAGARTVPA
jgi:hypothetical protein